MIPGIVNNTKGNRVAKVTMTILFIMSIVMGCKDPAYVQSTSSAVNITGYLQQYPEQFSKFLHILELTNNKGFLGAYGSYTCFAPTNDAVDTYLANKKVSSVDEISIEELKDVVRFHLLKDTISTKNFTDGKLGKPTMSGQYLITGATNVNGNSYVRVNRQANILKANNVCGNGIVHVIDAVLIPATLTVAQLVEQNPGYSIFSQILRETTFYDTLNIKPENSTDSVRRWFTLIAETDQVFAASGLTSYADVKAKYCKTGDPKNRKDSLFLFAAYHILPGLKYVADIISAPSHPTMAPLEVITARIDGDVVLLNSDYINGVQSPGVAMDRPMSDNSATNGVLHSAGQNFTTLTRLPTPVYFDVCDQPELRNMTDIFRKPGQSIEMVPGTFKDIKWFDVGTASFSSPHFKYDTDFTIPFCNGDRFSLGIRPGNVQYVEFTTPLIVRGKYKVWVCFRRFSTNDFQAFFDDKPLPRLFGLSPVAGPPNTKIDADLEAAGWKFYTSPIETSRLGGRLLGTIDVKTTDRHRFKIISLSDRGGSNGGNGLWLDMIHFIPVDKSQFLPRFTVNGEQVFK